jgi:hypothetical protein
MRKYGIIIFFGFIVMPLAIALGTSTIRQIDEIVNNTGANIKLNPTTAVEIPYLAGTGERLLFVNASGEIQEISAGMEGQVLTQGDGVLSFEDASGGGDSSPLTTKGDLYTFSTENTRLAVGANGKILGANSATTTGLEWIDPPIALPDQTGVSGNYLSTNGTSASWRRIDDDLNSVKMNLLANGSFDSVGIAAEYTVTTDAVVDLTTIVTRSGEKAPNNRSMLTIEATNGDSSPYDIKAVFTKTIDMSNAQMKAYCEIRTLRPDVKFIAGANGVSAGEQNVINDNKWRFYEIFLVGGDTSQYIEINGETTADELPIYVDNCFIGKVSPTDIREVSGAQYFGGVTAAGAANCTWSVTSTSFASYSADADCNAFIANGKVQAPATKIPAFVLPAGSPVGSYFIQPRFRFISSTSGGCSYRLTDGTFNSKTSDQFNTSGSHQVPSPGYYFNLIDSSSNRTIQFQARSSAGSCDINQASTTDSYGFDVYYFPDSTSNIVTQNTELTAKTANEFVANVAADGTVSGENLDWINGNCTLSGSDNHIKNCTFISGIFSSTPVCVASFAQAPSTSAYSNYVSSLTSSGVSLGTNDSGTTAARAVTLKCTRSTDYNKSATIIGKFNAENMGDNMKTKCQTKYLSANVTTNGSIASLSFSNLTIGKRYKINGRAVIQTTSDSDMELDLTHDSVLIERFLCGNSAGTSFCSPTASSASFVATATSISATAAGLGGTSPTIFGSNNRNTTYVQLCELPDTYVETTEW